MVVAMAEKLYSTRDVSRAVGVPLASVVRVADRLGLGRRVGRNRILTGEEVERVEIGLRAAGVMQRAEDRRHG